MNLTLILTTPAQVTDKLLVASHLGALRLHPILIPLLLMSSKAWSFSCLSGFCFVHRLLHTQAPLRSILSSPHQTDHLTPDDLPHLHQELHVFTQGVRCSVPESAVHTVVILKGSAQN